MGKEIRTRKIQKNIRTLDKGTVAAEHLKNVYVRTKDSVGQEQQYNQEQERTESVRYAEDKVAGAAELAVRRSARRIRKSSAFSPAGMGKAYSYLQRQSARDKMRQRSQERAGQQRYTRQQGQTAQGSAGSNSTDRTGIFPEQTEKRAGRDNKKSTMKPGRSVKTSDRIIPKPAGEIQAAQEAAMKTYVEAKVSRKITERMPPITGQTAITAEHAVKANIKAGSSAARAVAVSARRLASAVMAGGSVSIFLLIFILLFGGYLYTVGGSNSSAVSPVSEEVERYEPLIRKYANQYGIGEYVELLKAVMMQESGGRGPDPMQSSEGAFNTRYPRQPNGIKDPEYSIACGVQELKAALTKAEVKNPIDMERIKLALQGYNFGNGYISWAKRKYGGYSTANAAEFSEMMARRMGWSRYGDKEYVPHVLRYYAFGRIPTGIGNKAIVQVALSQEGNKGGRPYWSWYGYKGRVSWCACFVSWCADKCGYIDSGTIPKFSSCASGASWFRSRGRLKDRSYVPSSGDIIFFDWGAGVHHVGIVVDVKNGRVNTIEGNSSDAVRRRSYKIGDGRIHGYGVYALAN